MSVDPGYVINVCRQMREDSQYMQNGVKYMKFAESVYPSSAQTQYNEIILEILIN